MSGEIRQAKKQVRWKRLLPSATTILIFVLIFRRIPFAHFAAALAHADYSYFLLLMIPNSVVYFAWDTLVLTAVMHWFHGPVRYRELLPVRAVAYILALLNSDLAEGAMAVYLGQQARAPLLEIVSTVIFLSWLEVTHLSAWALVIHYLAAAAFGFHVPLTKLMAFLPMVFMLAALPITVAHLGTTQAASIFFFRAYPAPSQLLAFSLAAHLPFMPTRGALGLLFAPRAYQDLVGRLELARILRGQPAARPAAEPARDL